MKNKRVKIGYGGIFLLLIIGILYLWNLLFWERKRDLGNLSNSCDKNYKINITHYSEFEHKQDLKFNIIKNNKKIKMFGKAFAFTSKMDESLENF